MGFRKAKSLKDYLVCARLPKKYVSLGCFHCNCEICNQLEEATTFTDKDHTKEYKIQQGTLTVIQSTYLIQCKVCRTHGSTITKCRHRINNYKTKFRNYREKFLTGTLTNGQINQQASFHNHGGCICMPAGGCICAPAGGCICVPAGVCVCAPAGVCVCAPAGVCVCAPAGVCAYTVYCI